MLSFFDPIRNITPLGVFCRVLFAVIAGAMIGIERSSKNRPAGIRTHVLVCFGAALASVVGQYIFLVLKLPADMTRVSAQIISGLGFIGAGTIIITKKKTVKGLTTAAGLWVTGIVGLTIGSGYYEGGFIGAILILLTETVIGMLHGNIKKNLEYALEITYTDKESLDEILRLCKDCRMSITNLNIHSGAVNIGEYTAIVALRGAMKSSDMAEMIEQSNLVKSVDEL